MNAKNEENSLYYKYEDLQSHNSESYCKTAYENKLKMIPDIIYPEYKKGGKSLYELAMNYQIEKYLIEEYIQKIENQQTDNKSIIKEICHDKQVNYDSSYAEKITALKLNSLENKMMILEQKMDHIISIITK